MRLTKKSRRPAPRAAPTRQTRGSGMPNLHLSRTEIAALVAFLDADGRLSTR